LSNVVHSRDFSDINAPKWPPDGLPANLMSGNHIGLLRRNIDCD